MNLKKNRSGFTLLEIIIVIIIVGVLASLALPRFFGMVEFSKGTEALTQMGAIRQSMERCYLSTGDYTACDDLTALDIEDPNGAPGTRFAYAFTGATTATDAYTITATRNATDGGDGSSTVVLTYDSGSGVARSGTGKFAGIK